MPKEKLVRLALLVATVALVAVLVLIPLLDSREPERQNARQTPGGQVDRTPAEVYAMPEHYNNVASKCDKRGHRIFITSNKRQAPSNLVVIDDPSCGR